MAQYAAPHISTPLFLLNSALDSCQARRALPPLCDADVVHKANGCELGIDVSKVPSTFPSNLARLLPRLIHP